MKYFASLILLLFSSLSLAADYDRNKAVPVEKVLFGQVDSVRIVTSKDIIRDEKNGWRTFGGALIGGAIGHQFGGGSGKDVATILGAIIGASVADSNQQGYQEVIYQLVELLITVESGEQYMVIQDQDPNMVFASGDQVRLVYLTNDTVRIDKSY